MTLKTRKPTGKPPWPVALIAGVQKAGKSFAAAQASASPLIGRTIWFTTGEDDPDEYGAIPGADFDIVLYDGTFRDLHAQMKEAAAEPQDPNKPTLWVLDSGTKLWTLISDMAQAEANRRFINKAQKYNRAAEIPDDGVRVAMDLWNSAKTRWNAILDMMLAHQGPSIITARLEKTSVVENGEPTKEKIWKVQAEKNLAFECGVVIEMHARNEVYITGVRSLRLQLKQPKTEFPDFSMHELWTRLGLAADTVGPRVHVEATGEQSLAADDQIAARRRRLFAEITQAVTMIAVTPEDVDKIKAKMAAQWIEENGHDIRFTTDLELLQLLRDDMRTKATNHQMGDVA